LVENRRNEKEAAEVRAFCEAAKVAMEQAKATEVAIAAQTIEATIM